MSAIPPLLEGKQTLGELPENNAHDPQRISGKVLILRIAWGNLTQS
jgi:hypothetical protein